MQSNQGKEKTQRTKPAKAYAPKKPHKGFSRFDKRAASY